MKLLTHPQILSLIPSSFLSPATVNSLMPLAMLLPLLLLFGVQECDTLLKCRYILMFRKYHRQSVDTHSESDDVNENLKPFVQQ